MRRSGPTNAERIATMIASRSACERSLNSDYRAARREDRDCSASISRPIFISSESRRSISSQRLGTYRSSALLLSLHWNQGGAKYGHLAAEVGERHERKQERHVVPDRKFCPEHDVHRDEQNDQQHSRYQSDER